MRLVDPEVFDPWRIEGIAHNTADFVARIEILPTLEAAIADSCLVAVLTGARARRQAADPAAARGGGRARAGPRRRARSPSWRDGRTAGSPTPSWISAGTVVTIATDPASPVAQSGAGGGDHGLRDVERARRRARCRSSRRAARPGRPPRRQLEELFADWQRALWAIDFFKTRRSESVMRSFREIVLPRGARRPRGVAGARDGDRSGTLSPPGRRAARRVTAGHGAHLGRRGGMTRARSSAYWAANRYTDEATEPAPAAPLKDLPAPAAARFRALREGLSRARRRRRDGALHGHQLALGMGVRRRQPEAVLGARRGRRDLGHVHDERRGGGSAEPARAASRPTIRRAIDEGQRTGPLKWCWLALDDRRAVDDFLRLAGRKAEWLGERPAPQRAPRARPRRAVGATESMPTKTLGIARCVGLCNRNARTILRRAWAGRVGCIAAVK